MTTFLTLKQRIADDLARSDLSNQIETAILDSIENLGAERFYFNETRSITFNTVAAQDTYTDSDNAFISNLVRIDALFLVESSTNIWPLDRYYPPDFELVANDGSTGKPTCFTYVESTIKLWPIPDDVYSMRVHGYYKLTALSADSDSNAWTTDAEELVRTEAKARLYLHVIRDPEKAAMLAIASQGFKERLRQETSSRTGIGRLTPTEF